MDGGQPVNGRHKPEHHKTAQLQWLAQPQPSMKQIMAIIAERDTAIRERNTALYQKNAAFAERDMAFLQRDSAIAQQKNAIIERDNAIATLQILEGSPNGRGTNMPSCPPGFQSLKDMKHVSPLRQQKHIPPTSEAPHTTNAQPSTPTASEPVKSRRGKKANKSEATPVSKSTSKSPRKQAKRESEGFSKSPNSNWKENGLGLTRVAYESSMPVPVCSCTGVFRQCYKWGIGGWQSACCTTTISMYPLPMVPNKPNTRVGGRKMSGGAFSRLLSRLVAEGHHLSSAINLKGHWARHGTNRYITIR